MAEKVLEVIDLQTIFRTNDGETKAVDKISFTLYRGETLGIVGESGSGKSVTSLSIMRLLLMPSADIAGGQVLFYPKNGGAAVDLLRLSEKEMQAYRGRELAMIFQEPMSSLNPVFTCGEQVCEAILLHRKIGKKEAKQEVIDIFKRVQLVEAERIFDAYPHQLSGGQKQRVMIAMALSCKPSVLIADEPTTALDVTVQKAILELLHQLQHEEEESTIFISHDLGVIAEVADRVLVMYRGRIVEEGTVYAIFKNPQHPYTKGLLACRPPLDYRLKRLPIVADFMTATPTDSWYAIDEKSTSIKALTDDVIVTIDEQNARLTDLYTQKALISVENISTWFPRQLGLFGGVKDYIKAVDNVSFEVYPGETLGVVGESGCGKTTLGRSMLRLIEPQQGSVYFAGKDLMKMSAEALNRQRREMQIVFQDPFSSLNPRVSIGSAIIEPMQVHGLYEREEERTRRVYELLDIVGLERRHFNRYPHELSGGQRQRVCIARALSLNPRFIICDESVSALDVSVQAQVLNLLMELRKEFSFTYIFISHDLSVVKFMSDRMMIMNQGKIEEIGDADLIYNNPQKAYTYNLINAVPKGSLETFEKRLRKAT